MTWKKILKEIRPDPTADPNDSGATGISPQAHGVTGDPVYDITEHHKYPGREVHGSAGNANIVEPVNVQGKIASLISYYGEGWDKHLIGPSDPGNFVILRQKQGGTATKPKAVRYRLNTAQTQLNPKTAPTQLKPQRSRYGRGKWLPGKGE